MEDLIEFLLELVLEGAVEGAASKRLPKWLRLLLLTVAFVPFALLFGVLAWDIFANGPLWLAAIMAAVTLAIVLGYIVLVYRIVRNLPFKRRKTEQVGNENPDEE